MKAIHSFAAFIAVLVALSAVSVKGQTNQEPVILPNTLPSELPIGSLERIWEWDVTNRSCNVSFSFHYDDHMGTHRNIGRSGSGVTFPSYASYRECLLTNFVRLYDILLTKTNVASTITASAMVEYYNDLGGPLAFLIDTNIGQRQEITANVFVNLKPRLTQAVIPIRGMEQLTIEVDSDPPYRYQWPPTGIEPTLIPSLPEHTTDDTAVLWDWYSSGDLRARFTIVANGYTNVYTQSGALLTQPSLEINTDSGEMRVFVKVPRGSDTTVWSSTGLLDWQEVATMPWSCTTNEIVLRWQPPSGETRRFFKAMSR